MRTLWFILLLTASNVFMTYAWYGHLKQRSWSIGAAILISWMIALPEYCLQVPANRMGHANFGGPFRASQLKVIQEAITLCVFTLFALFILREQVKWNDFAAFGLVFAAVAISVAR